MGDGVVPTWRFFAAYVGALYGSLQLASMHWSGGLLVFLAAVMMVWGVYAKLRYDMMPYLFKRLAWAVNSTSTTNSSEPQFGGFMIMGQYS